MARLIINRDLVGDIGRMIALCPFGAMEELEGELRVNAACRMCKICVKKGPEGAVAYVDDHVGGIDKSLWKGIAVYVDHIDGVIHPVTYELAGKARELASKINHPVYAVMMGSGIMKQAHELLHYGVDKVCAYDDEKLERFRIEPYTAAFEDFAVNVKPTAILVGATPVGRQLAPRLAARLRTGLTADCTVLDINDGTDLVQIRPAFGGNIMAQILTPRHRPQMATVRYKVMDSPARNETGSGEVVRCAIPPDNLASGLEVLEITAKPREQYIEAAEVLVVAGRGLKKAEDLNMLLELADLLGGQLACTRPVTEAGWLGAKRQIGLSGRTVRPKLIITCGVSGSVQFTAGMDRAEVIISINKDENAPIFKTAHYGLVGDLYEIIPALINMIRDRKGDMASGL